MWDRKPFVLFWSLSLKSLYNKIFFLKQSKSWQNSGYSIFWKRCFWTKFACNPCILCVWSKIKIFCPISKEFSHMLQWWGKWYWGLHRLTPGIVNRDYWAFLSLWQKSVKDMKFRAYKMGLYKKSSFETSCFQRVVF